MAPQEQEYLKAPDSEMLLNMVLSLPELEPAKKELARNFDEVKKLAEANMQLHTELNQQAEGYELKFAEYNSLKQQNEELKAREAQITEKMSKQKVISVLDKKIANADAEGKSLEKAYYKTTSG